MAQIFPGVIYFPAANTGILGLTEITPQWLPFTSAPIHNSLIIIKFQIVAYRQTPL